MGKVSKRLLIVLLIGAFVLPMFVGCDNGGSEPVDYKADFLGELKTETGKIAPSVATVTITGEDIAVVLKTNTKTLVETEAQKLVDALKGITATGTTLTIAGGTYKLHDAELDLEALGVSVKNGLNSNKISYTAKVIYSGNTVNLSGTITFTLP